MDLNKSVGVPVEFVEAAHPMNESFHQTNSFDDIEKAQRKLGQTLINWIGTGTTTTADGTLACTAPDWYQSAWR